MGKSTLGSHAPPVYPSTSVKEHGFEATPGADGYVRFWGAGESVKGEFHCAECGYGVAVYRELPPCPQCGGTSWEQSTWSPFARALESNLH
jgi:hypothetical protein